MPVLDRPTAPTRRRREPSTMPSPTGPRRRSTITRRTLPAERPNFDGFGTDVSRGESGTGGGPFIVIVFNDEVHSFDEVEEILIKATGCTMEKAEALAVEIDAKGRAICFSGDEEECGRVAAIIGSIGLQVETDRA